MIMMQIAFNRTKRTEPPKFIVVHTTGNYRAGADANAHFQYWNSGNVDQSADFVVDDKRAIQINDYEKYYTWHCGDGKGKYGITNSNSIGIEICVNADGNFEKAVDNAIHLIKNLKKSTGIQNVVRHYDASRKKCPAEFAKNNWAEWEVFLSRINDEDSPELETVNDIVWELSHRALITDTELWLKKLKADTNVYWLARKCANYIRGNCK